jgi:8-oxo-dGTP pyrophosphatase MutT (NUDIX family)
LAEGSRVAYKPPTWPVSVKGVALDASGRVLLLKNERQEWELPGGRLEIGDEAGGQVGDDSPEAAIEREILEETGWQVIADRLIPGGTWIYEPRPGQRVLIITYGCVVLTPARPPVVSQEHSELGLFAADEVDGLDMPPGYKKSIAAWFGRDSPRRPP